MSPQLRRSLLWCALALLAALYLQRNLVAAASHLGPTPSDFWNYWAAAVAWVGGGSPYTVHNFDYPPLTAVIALPLALLDYPTARAVWFLASHLFLLAAAVVVWRRLGGGLSTGVVVAAVWALAGTVAANLVLGQVNPLLLLLVALATTGLARSRDLSAGSAIGLAAALKAWPGTLVWPAMVGRRWRTPVAALLVAAVGLAAPLLALVVANPPPYGPTSSGYWAGTPAFLNLSLPATALRLADLGELGRELPPSWRVGNNPEQFQLDTQGAALSLLVAGVTLLLGFAWIRHRQRPDTQWTAALGATIAVTLAAAPVSWYHYRLLHFPALAWLLATLLRQRRWARVGLAALLGLGLTWSQTLHGDGAWHFALEPWSVLIRGAAVPIAELVLAWWLLRVGQPATARAPQPITPTSQMEA